MRRRGVCWNAIWLPLKKEVAPALPSICGINSGLTGTLVREAILRDLVSWLQCPVIVNGDFSNAEESKRICFRKSFYVQKQQSPACSSKVEQIPLYDLSVIDCSHFHWLLCQHIGQIALQNVCVCIFTHVRIYMELSEVWHEAFLVIRAVAKLWLFVFSTMERFSQSEKCMRGLWKW